MGTLFPDGAELARIQLSALCGVICKLSRDKRINSISTDMMVEMVEKETARLVSEFVGRKALEERDRQTKTAATVS